MEGEEGREGGEGGLGWRGRHGGEDELQNNGAANDDLMSIDYDGERKNEQSLVQVVLG